MILSAALIEFDPDGKYTYQELIDKAIFVKFDAQEQIRDYKRTIDRSTIEWWNKQTDYVKSVSFKKSDIDESAATGVEQLRIKPNTTIWARGSLDQMVIDSICKNLKVPPITDYNRWRDIRTAIDILKDTASNGYCDVPNFNRQDVCKHHPVHDCAYDVMMLLYGK